MKAIGSIRKIDGLGRVVIPMDMRKTLGIRPGEPLGIFATTEGIFIRPYDSDKADPPDMKIDPVQM